MNTNEDELPYKEIKDCPEAFSHGNIIKRFIDGLGYRYYWATESLTEADVTYRISSDSRTMLETLEHISDLSGFILRIVQKEYNGKRQKKENVSLQAIRSNTLKQFKKASELISEVSDDEINSYDIKFQKDDAEFSMPFWNTFNGPIADAIYHTGQIVAYRRAAGNPICSNVNVLTGKNKSNR